MKEACRPMRAPNLVKYPLFMFTACTHPSVKESIVSAFTNINSPLGIAIAGWTPSDINLIFKKLVGLHLRLFYPTVQVLYETMTSWNWEQIV